jgi:Icc protein
MAVERRISRRELLAGSLGAGVASLLFQKRLWSADAPIDPNRFVLLADTHVCEDRDKILRDANPYENFQHARQQYQAVDSRPAGLILAGDCVFLKGEPGDYERLKELVAPIPFPVTFALGNHDHREHFWAAFPEQQAKRSPVAERHATLIETPHADWFVLDSLDKTNSTPGRMGETQLKWLAAELDRRPEKPALLVAHHYPLPKDNPGEVKSALLDTAELYDVILSRKRVKAYFFGHSHRWERSKIDDLHLVNIAALAWLFDPKQPRGWVDAELKEDCIRLTLQCLDPAHSDHGRPIELAWR